MHSGRCPRAAAAMGFKADTRAVPWQREGAPSEAYATGGLCAAPHNHRNHQHYMTAHPCGKCFTSTPAASAPSGRFPSAIPPRAVSPGGSGTAPAPGRICCESPYRPPPYHQQQRPHPPLALASSVAVSKQRPCFHGPKATAPCRDTSAWLASDAPMWVQAPGALLAHSKCPMGGYHPTAAVRGSTKYCTSATQRLWLLPLPLPAGLTITTTALLSRRLLRTCMGLRAPV